MSHAAEKSVPLNPIPGFATRMVGEGIHPDGNGWSKLFGNYTARGEWLYWEDGTRTPNTREGTEFTGFHGGAWDNHVDYAAKWDAAQCA
jgi:hypothetical protein